MKRGWIIYDRSGAARNQWFIKECLLNAERCGMCLSLKIVGGEPITEFPDFALVRTINPLLSQDLDRAGVRLFNNAQVSVLANDKWETYVQAKRLGIKVMPTELSAYAQNASPFSYPVVVKSRDGHGGEEVYRMETAEEYRAFFRANDPNRYITQKLCSEVGKDLRVYVLGGEILAGVLRTSTVDFRSNYSLGGEVQLVPVPDEIQKTVKKLHEEYAFDFVGVDFIRDGSEWVLNEIEDVVGSRMLYKTANLDVARLYISHIASKIR